jgi:two-component system response regulator FlrC
MASKSILIIDDDQNLRKSMALILQRAGYRVDTAGTSVEALTDLEKAQYDLAILDMMMPDEGTILMPRLHRLYPGLPILILSAQLTPEVPLENIRFGKTARLVKPVTPETLLQNVKTILATPSGSKSNHPKRINGERNGIYF